MPGHQIRPFAPGDQGGAVAVFRLAMETALAAASEAERSAGQAFIEWSLTRDLKNIADHYLGSDEKRFWVATVDSTVVGTVGVDRDSDGAPEIRRMVVHPDFQRRGIARGLLDTSENWARSRGDRSMVLSTAHLLRSAIALYEAHGYKRVGADRHGPIEEIHFSKDLTVGPAATP